MEFGFGYKKGLKEITDTILDEMALNTRKLSREGWHGTYFDAVFSSKRFHVVKAILTEANIVENFAQASVPYDVDYMHIDVDSVDVWLLRSVLLSKYRPRVFSIEYNSNYPPTEAITNERRWHPYGGHNVYGASALAIHLVANSLGYTLVHVMRSLEDMFFIRNDIIQMHCDMTTIPSFLDQAAFLPQQFHSKCNRQDLLIIVDLPLALKGDEEAAHGKAITIAHKIGMCRGHAFQDLPFNWSMS